jgi:hypothetical protein
MAVPVEAVLLAVVVITLLMIVYLFMRPPPERMSDASGFATQFVVPPSVDNTAADPSTKSFMQMTSGEQVQFILDNYFEQEDDSSAADQINKENAYINSLPVDGTSCTDNYTDCAKWASGGECSINPEFMLYNCPSSCQSCSLTPQQKNDITVIYNSREPAACVNHGSNYPGPYPFLNKLYAYNLHYT